MSLVIIDYKGGNTKSVLNALNRLNYKAILSRNASDLNNATKVILPGVGEARTAMKSLDELKLIDVIKNLKVPVLGICLGLQLFYKLSMERETNCLGIIDEKIVKFSSEEKVPHMGWNSLDNLESKLFRNVAIKDFVYFVHSYYAPLTKHTIATSNYGNTSFSAAIKKNNFYAVQFHPEKSGVVGSTILKNFLEI